MKKILMFLLCLFAFTVNLYAETYYDKEIVKVDTLPTASETTLDKVYQVDNKYYITNKVPGATRSLQVGDTILNNTFIFDFPDDIYKSFMNATVDVPHFIVETNCSGYGFNYRTYSNASIKTIYLGSTAIYSFNISNNSIQNRTSYIPTYIPGYINCGVSNPVITKINNDFNLIDYIKISTETTYTWQEVNKTDVIKYETKIYIPEKERYKCFVVQSEGVIRGYEEIPQNNTTINYRDYYINSDYIFRDGHQTFGSNSSLPSCLSSDVITDEIYYRVDFYKILIMFLIISIVCIYLPLKIFFKLFKRGGF